MVLPTPPPAGPFGASPSTLAAPHRTAPSARVADLAGALLEVHPWVGSPSAQAALDDALLAVCEQLLGPPTDPGAAPPAWVVGDHGRADLASVRATAARLVRTAHGLQGAGEHPAGATACLDLAGALHAFAEDLVEVSLRHRAASPRGDGPVAQPIGALRAAKQLTTSCRRVTEALTGAPTD